MFHLISVIAVSLNEERFIPRLKAAVDALKRPTGVDVETVLVDGGSLDRTVATARAAGFTRIIELPGASIPVCRNAGLREARGDWIAFLDGDCEPAPNWLDQAAFFLAREGNVILGWPARPPEPMTWVQAAWTFHWTQKNRIREDRYGHPVVVREGFRLVTTRNLLMTRAVADRLGGFNEELATGEDTDFVFRANRAGIPVWGVPSLQVIHYGEPATLGAWFRQQLWHANRKSYKHIARLSGAGGGGNAPLFTVLYALTLGVGLVAAIGSLITNQTALLAGCLPWLGLVVGPAALMSKRGRNWRHFAALCLLYAVYGWARTVDLLGLHPVKASWKGGAPR